MIESILDQCLADIHARRATIADCLAKYPEFAEELKPLLEMAVAIEEIPAVKPSSDFKRATRNLLSRLGKIGLSKADGRIMDPSSTEDESTSSSVRTTR